MTAVADPLQQLAGLFAGNGADADPGGPAGRARHMLQAAALAEAAGAPPALVAAALLHDCGHFAVTVNDGVTVTDRRAVNDGVPANDRGATDGRGPGPGADDGHAAAGARWLSRWFGEQVTEPVRLHVAAKRYLCAVEPGYLGDLPAAGRATLAAQGGPMDDAEAAEFEAHPLACDALRLRRWDDAARDPAASPPAFGYYRPLLRRLLRPRLLSPGKQPAVPAGLLTPPPRPE